MADFPHDTPASLADEFRNLAAEFRRIDAPSDDAAHKMFRRVQCLAGRAVRRANDAGLLGPLQQNLSGMPIPTDPGDEQIWAALWLSFLFRLPRVYPESVQLDIGPTDWERRTETVSIGRVLGAIGWREQAADNGRACEFVAELLASQAESATGGNDLIIGSLGGADLAGSQTKVTRKKRSTERGEGRGKLIAALTLHHRYADGGCMNLEPIGNNDLARLAKVDKATSSAFFEKEFKGHDKYKALCNRSVEDTAQLVNTLKLLNGEFAPHVLYGDKPPDEGDRGEE